MDGARGSGIGRIVGAVLCLSLCGGCGRTTNSGDAASEQTMDSGVTSSVDAGGMGGAGGSGTSSGGTQQASETSGGTTGIGGNPSGTGASGGTENTVSLPAPACEEGRDIDLAPEVTAERLAQLFWHQSAPEALLESARNDGLATIGAVSCFAREMLEDARADEGIADFFEGWLDLGKYPEPLQEPEYVPEFTPEIVEVARHDAVRFALEIWRGSSATLVELLQSSHATVSEPLAPFYGSGDETGWIDFGEQRSGILTQLYFLITRTSKAHGSPTQRGIDMVLMLGCESIPQPPLAMEADAVPAEFEGTTRQWYEESHAASPACSGCHHLMDGAGFVFEHFDVMGRYRTEEAGTAIDATGWLPMTDTPDTAVNDHNAAMQVLSESTHVRRCFASQWYGYALGSLRGVRAYATDLEGQASADWVDYLVARASANKDFDLTELFLAAVESEEFLSP